jgi:small-conductance mechanosensitive channel
MSGTPLHNAPYNGISCKQSWKGLALKRCMKAGLFAWLSLWFLHPGLSGQEAVQPDSIAVSFVIPPAPTGYPVLADADTLFLIRAPLGPFSAKERADAIEQKITVLMRAQELPGDSVRVAESAMMSTLMIDTTAIMVVTDDDARLAGRPRNELAGEYASKMWSAVKIAQAQFSLRSLLVAGGIILLSLAGTILVFWLMAKFFPRVYDLLESWEGRVFRSIHVRSFEIISADTLTSIFIVVAKGIRLVLSLGVIYLFLSNSFGQLPWTRTWDISPILGGVLGIILVTAVGGALARGVNSFFTLMVIKIPGWRGTLIKPVRVKTVEVLSEDRIAELLTFGFKVLRFGALIVIGYFYVTLVFSFFVFSRTWAGTLVKYIVTPLLNVFSAFISYLPQLFFIVVIIFVTRGLVKIVKALFAEVGRGAISFPGFHAEWAQPTYKIVRFLIFVFAAIVIFPYLPGSDSPAFQGISVFLGILFSLGSTSAISNIVSGVVLTYMRPFNEGDRVKIADTTGDVIEKTLLVTRVRTVKNVDITIPNAMVLGSHIINFSSSAKARGLILHTTVTIGYDVPWRKVHELLVAAAAATEHILKEPPPFVLQTRLDDFYPTYELNAYTGEPNLMSGIYSVLHQNIQDKFHEAGVEIMSPHYSAVRDGNQVAIPADYLPKSYSAPAFRIFPWGNPAEQKSPRQ